MFSYAAAPHHSPCTVPTTKSGAHAFPWIMRVRSRGRPHGGSPISQNYLSRRPNTRGSIRTRPGTAPRDGSDTLYRNRRGEFKLSCADERETPNNAIDQVIFMLWRLQRAPRPRFVHAKPKVPTLFARHLVDEAGTYVYRSLEVGLVLSTRVSVRGTHKTRVNDSETTRNEG